MNAFVQMEHLACTLDQLRLMGGRIQNLSRAPVIKEVLKGERNSLIPFDLCAETMEEVATLLDRSDFGILVAKKRMELWMPTTTLDQLRRNCCVGIIDSVT